ncbi:MAG: CHAD domain-containing protein [Calditerrivibrio sp.]|nr:CHAD domain-containing protein [Calditerrivibrio sp.]
MISGYIVAQLTIAQELLSKIHEYTSDETLHDLRVALRRFFTVFNLLKKEDLIPVEIQVLADNLKVLRRETNRLRDLEVFREHVNKIAFDTDFSKRSRDILNTIIDKKIKKEHAVMMEMLQNMELSDKISFLIAHFQKGSILVQLDPHLRRLQKRIKKMLSEDADNERIHRIRVFFKRIRYLIEVIDADSQILHTMKKLQDLLGVFNDYVIGRGIIKEILEEKYNISKDYLYVLGYTELFFVSQCEKLRPVIYEEAKSTLKHIKQFWD